MRLTRQTFRSIAAAAALSALAACQTVQTTQGGVVGIDRQQRMAVAPEAINQAAAQEYAQVIAEARAKGLLNTKPSEVQRVRAIAARLIPQTVAFRPDAVHWAWETNVLTSNEVNAWCMPGGKIAVYSALIEKLQVTDDELAAVMGHEISHALREHARERASEQAVADLGLQVGAALLGLGDMSQQVAQYAYMGLVGLPHSRAQETEADRLGVELAARAGYDPRAAVTLWQKMQGLGGGAPVKFLSTHPAPAERLQDLTAYSQRVMPLYEQARRR
ncbi:M48 family peptidase [Oxalobacteraceae bacterium OM1]|nr:M48 family peptidase [Oxalobacteraceae bacterium OM1]